MSQNIIKMTLFDREGFLITAADGKRGIFAWKDEGSRPSKRKIGKKPIGTITTWKKIWFASVYKSERYKDMPWRFANSGGKYPFARVHFDTDVFVLLFDLIPFIYKEFFGATVPWSTPVEVRKDFKPKDEDEEVAKLMKELAGLRV